ncbi:LLM class flavin-dependent oxidoreductase [Cryptosporangium sp. NPDC051539]|uniref:LLM class flavin-dependent oxidoreductase n=1 Tax=Cryptosporangium sp. NPDC051539 TaxID=3363962 RepID=UPI0037912431
MNSASVPIMMSPRTLTMSGLQGRVRTAEKLGFDEIWVDQHPDVRDATLVASAYLQAAPTITVGTGILPIYARHPVTMAESAATLAEMSDGRYVLGLGYSHHFVNEYVLGYRQGPPIQVMQEYLFVVRTLLTEGGVDFDGEYFSAHTQYVNPRPPVPIYLAALRPKMIRLAVESGDGLILWLCSPRYVAERVMPIVREACAEFGKDADAFPVLAILPTYTGRNLADVRALWARSAKSYRMLPHYRRILEAFGPVDPDEVSLMGSPDHLAERMAAYRELGCVPMPSPLTETDDEFAEVLETLKAVQPSLAALSGGPV